MSNKPNLIHLICDYGTGDLAFSEVINHLNKLLPDIQILPLSAPPFSTLNTGFLIAQLALYGYNPNIFIYSNTAPRLDKTQKRHNNAGEKFKYIKLDNGIEIAAVDAGYNLSFLKNHIKVLKNINIANQGSQFRSRDFYPKAVASIIKGDSSFLAEDISLNHIPDVPKNKIVHIDAYGNIKTTIRKSEVTFKLNQKITVTINNVSLPATFVDGSFSVKNGQLAFSPGSSGGQDPFMEVFLRGFNTAEKFNYPRVESLVNLTAA